MFGDVAHGEIMSDLSDVCCNLCKTDMATQFTGGSATRTQAVISGNVFVPGPCYVADTITFVSPSALIFDPNLDQSSDRPEFAVICRRLIVKGGKAPVDTTPCNPGDPGSRYGNTNVITWKGRLASAPAGAPMGPPAPQPANSGMDGMNGQNGNAGSNGSPPAGAQRAAAAKLALVALEVEFLSAGNLSIDWAGQNGGDGGAGQLGGNAGSGITGNNGSDESWPSSGCATPTGNGGAGGNGGNGGNGGQSGQIIVISTPANIAAAGPFNDPSRVTYVTKSVGGTGGKGAHGGLGGDPGVPGARSSSCGPGAKGTAGASQVAAFGTVGAAGGVAPGSPAANPVLEALTTGDCAEPIPSHLKFGANSLPQSFRRCSSGSGIGSLSLGGQFLDQVVSVSTSLAAVTATIAATSTDTQLDLNFMIAANSATGLGDLVFAYGFPAGLTQTLAGAINVVVCAATAIAPVFGVQGSTVAVTITGQAFDLTAAVHQVSVSGLDVTVQAGSVAVVSETTITCTLVIGPTAPKTARNVIVTAGTIANPCQSTLTGAFTVT
jgi:hypothetical protein